MSIDPRDLQYFATIVEYGQIGRAAEVLGLSQPALSKSVRRLETAAGAQLLERTRKGVVPTSAGSALFARVRPLKLALDDALRELADLSQGQAGGIRVGIGMDTAEDVVTRACALVMKESPNVHVKIVLGSFDGMLPSLLDGELELIVSGLPRTVPESVACEHLYDHDFAVYASMRHRLATRRSLTMADLGSERWTLAPPTVNSAQWVYRAFEDRGLPAPRVVVELPSSVMRMQVVAATDLIGVFWRQTIHRARQNKNLAMLPVRELTWKRRVGIVTRAKAYHSPLTRRTIAVMRSIARNLAGET